jgi:metallo-beta-lactamase family protein
MKAPDMIREIDYLVLESTYGDRLHKKGHPKDFLKALINKTVERGGTILIPAFAVGRAQSILHYIARLRKEEAIPNIPIFLDSPMAIDATSTLLKHQDELRLTEEDCRELNGIATYTSSPSESAALSEDHAPKIIISASGMATGGRVLQHLQIYAPHAKNTIIFTGYQATGTRGFHMMEGEKIIKIYGEMVPILAEVAMLDNASAHADYGEILTWLGHFNKPPKKVFITHGEIDAANALKDKIEHELGWHCIVPKYRQQENLP